MERSDLARSRPLSPHLGIYRWTATMAMSILHRLTGLALYFGTVLVAWWLVAAATSTRWFEIADAAVGSWPGLLVLLGFTFAMYLHALGGVRHALWDVGYAIDKRSATGLAWGTLAGAVLLTALTWAAYLLLF